MPADTALAPAPPPARPALEMIGIEKRFPGVVALDDVDLRLEPGKVHALMGENGAGKSTLIKILAGVYEPDAGTIRIAGREVEHPQSRATPSAQGIKVVFQEIALIAEFTVAENIFLEEYPVGRAGSIDWRADPPRRQGPLRPHRLRRRHRPRAPATCRSASSRWSRSPGRCPTRRGSSSWTSRPRR